MFEGVVAGFLNRLLGKYVEDLNTEDLNVGIFSGSVLLTDLKLKPEALFELDLPIDVKIGTVGRISIQIPWSSLQRAPVVVRVEDVLLLVAPSVSHTSFDPEREKRLCRAHSKRKLLLGTDDAEILSGPQDIVESLYTAMVNNLQVHVRNVHIRYEDTVSSRDGPLACGLCLQSASIETTNSKWKPSISTAGTSPIYQLVRIEALSVYWVCQATAMDEQQITNISPMQYYNWKHYMLTLLQREAGEGTQDTTVLDPFSCKIKVIVNRSGEPRVPKLLVDALVQDSSFHLSRRQYLSMDNLITSIKRMNINRKYRHLHPNVPLTQSVKKWWQYAYNAVLEQRVRPYTWQAIRTHRQNYLKYKKTYMSVLNSPHDTELKMDLQLCQDCLPVVSVLIAREHAKIQLHAKESSLVEIQESDSDWWKPWADKSTDGQESKTQIIAKSEKQKTLWSHLSSPEKKKVCELIGYVEGAPRQNKPKQYIEHKINLTLANSSITLLNRDKEIFALTLSQFLVSLETRPSAKSYKLSCRAESIVVEGLGAGDALCPLLLPAKPSSPSASVNFLSLDFERNPVNSEADYGVQVLVEPADFCYNEHAIQELINLFQIRPWECPSELGAPLRRGLARAATSHVLNLHVDVKGSSLALHQGPSTLPGRMIVLDINRILIKSDLQPSNLALEDATCMELEEKLYDRLHAECTFQILFCDNGDPWREARKNADSDLHLVPKTKIQVVFSNSTKKDYKLLPRYKLNVSITSLKLNLSDRIIGLLLDFLDNLPIPVPNTVPVSFLDSGDFMDDLEDPALVEMLMMDRIQPDPSCKELIRLRQKIVAAYLGRTRAAQHPIDKELAKESFQAAASTVFVSSEHSDTEMEVYARSIDLPGFDDNVSPSNHIDMLMRFVVGEIQINLSRSSEDADRAYLQLRVEHMSVECADMTFGPALQFSAARVSLLDASHQLLLLDTQEHCVHMLYRKVRADCPDFRSHFHSVEQSLVLDLGDISLQLHSGALHTMLKYLQYIWDKIQQRHAIYPKKIVSKARDLWNEVMKPELDPPVPTGATKFSYSFRASQLKAHVTVDAWSLAARVGGVQSELIFRANDRMLLKLFVLTVHADVQDEPTLYPALIWPDEDKVLEMKLVLAAPRLYGAQREEADGELRLHVGRLHVVVFHSVLARLQQFLDPLIPPTMAYEAMHSMEQHFQKHLQVFRTSQARLNLVIEIHAPILLLPQKPSSPTLLVLNMGDLQIENFFKRVKTSGSPSSAPVIDNILIKWTEVTLSRAIMTLAGTLELQAPILEPISASCDLKRHVSGGGGGGSLWLDAAASVDCVSANLAQLDLAALHCITGTSSIPTLVPYSPVETQASDVIVKKLQEFFAQGEPIKKEAVFRCTLEGFELKLFSDMDEVLSSPVRDPNHGLAKLTAGEMSVHIDWYSDKSSELKASLQSLLVEDIQPTALPEHKRILSDVSRSAPAGVTLLRPPLVDVCVRRTRSGVAVDARVDRLRVAAAPALTRILHALADAMPGEKRLEGGVVNHGYVGDAQPPRHSRAPSCSETSGYYSTAASLPEDVPSMSISIQFRQPEIAFYPEPGKSRHELLLRAELIVDYSFHSHTENLVVSLAGLQMVSKMHSKLTKIPPHIVLRPCDVEFSKSFKSLEEGIRINFSVSEINLNISPSTVHTITDIIDDVTSELTLPEEKEPFKFSGCEGRARAEEDLWAPKKVSPAVYLDDGGYSDVVPVAGPPECFNMNIPSVRIVFNLQHDVLVPVLVVKLSTSVSLTSWGRGVARVSVCAHGAHGEALLEPTRATLTITQDKAYPMSSKLVITPPNTDTDNKDETQRRKRKSRFEPETSAEEDTDNEMVFMGPPNANENKGCNELNLSFLSALDEDDSDSDNDSGVMDKLVNAIGHLFTDDSSDEEEVSSAAASEAEMVPSELDGEKAVSFTDADAKGKREGEHKTVTLQEPEREDSMDSGLDTEAFMEKMCTYFILESESDIKFTLTPSLCNALNSLVGALTDKTGAAFAPPAPALQLLNYIGPGSTVHLITRSETDLAGHDRTLAVADYDAGDSRPSTPDCDTSSADMLDELEVKMPGIPEIVADGDEDEDCFDTVFKDTTPIRSPKLVPESTQELYARITNHRLSIRVHDLDELTVLCPQRSVQKLHVLHPSRNGTRYYVVVERKADLNRNTIVVRSPLQIRNETSYPLELYYRKRDLQALGVEVIGSILNPFEGLLRVGTVAPADTYTVPLYIAYHSTLLLKPTHPQNYQAASQGIWWMDLANDLGTPRDLICPAKEEGDNGIFAMRVVATEGVKSPKSTRAIPNYLIRVLPPLAIYNRLTYALELSIEALSFRVRIEAGERVYSYIINLLTTHVVNVEIHNQGQLWTGTFKMMPTMTEKRINLVTDSEPEGGNKFLHVNAMLRRADCTQLCLYAPYWLINKTAAPMQLKVCRSDTIYKLTTPGVVTARGGDRFRVSLGGGWTRSFLPLAAPPAALRAAPPAPLTTLCQITLSELCPQLTKIVTFLPLYIVYNDTKRHLRYMEENEAADLWLDLAPQQCTAFYPQTTSMMMHCKYRDSRVVSAHFPINVNHITVLRMDKGSAIVVQNTGGVDRPHVTTFKPYSEGDAPVRVDNLCADLFLKLHQIHSGQVALLSPYQSMLYTWDDPSRERALVWNIYNNKGKGFIADFSKDGFGEEKVSFHSVKHTTLVATNSVTSKLSSTLKRLTPKSPSPNSSSSDDSDSSDLPETHTKKMRKDKVIVFWISYRDGYQRVFALTQDERIASQYRMRITPEKSNYEFIMSVPNISLSACVQSKNDVKELAYISITDSLPSWEVHVSHKWKELTRDLTAWIEDKYQTEQKKCQLKDYIHIDLEKMQMTKPFFSELRRTYNPGIWLQLRKSETHTYLNLKIHRLQVDNQLNDAIFPCVLYPAPVPPHLKKPTNNPSLEISFLKQYKQDINQEVYKHFKVLIEEHCLKLDRGFVNYVFDILNHWKVEEKPAVRLRADLASVHMPLLLIAMRSQFYGPKNVVFENVYMSPVKLSVSLSSRGYSAESPNPRSSWLSSKHENRPRLFNSDLLEHLFSSWGASLSDMKDVDIVIPVYTVHNAALPLRRLLEQWRLHSYPPLLQQIYVKILALQILVNRRTADTGAVGSCTEEITGGQIDISKLLGRGLNSHRASCQTEVRTEAIPASVLEASRSHPAYIVLALSGLIAKPNLDLCRSAARAPLTRQLGSVCCVLRCLQRTVEARRRLPRHCTAPEGFPCYCYHSAVGQQLFLQLARGHFADSGRYLAHAALPHQPHVAVLVSTRHVFLVRAGVNYSWHIEWAVKLDDLLGVPAVQGDKLVLQIKQDELVNYYSTDEKIVEVPDPDVLAWIQARIECALILAMEDKRCPTHF